VDDNGNILLKPWNKRPAGFACELGGQFYETMMRQ
jgi:hypothetical protein